MLLKILRKLIYIPLVLFIIITMTFFMVRNTPGAPFSDDKELDKETIENLNKYFHMDKPMGIQYLIMLGNVIRLDFGPSMKNQDKTVNQIIATHLPVSIKLGIISMIIALWIGISAGIISALRANTLLDYSAMSATVLGISLPTFVFGPLLQIAFSMKYDLLPLDGVDSWQCFILPSFTLALPFASRFARLMRAGMLDILSEDFIKTARSKGLSERTIIIRHALRGGILPCVSFLGPAVAAVLTGSMVIEHIFSIPGLGEEFVKSAQNRDYTLVMGTTIVYGAMIVVFNLICDASYAILDPRVDD